MEELRKRMAADGALDLFPAKAKAPQARRPLQPILPSSPKTSSIISISSVDSSPAAPQSQKEVRTVIEIDSDHSPSQLPRIAKPPPKRLVWDSDSDDVVSIRKDLAQATTSTDNQLISVARSSSTVPFTKPPTTIHAPKDVALRQQPKQSSGPLWETFDEPDVGNLYDPKTSTAEAERALQDLLSQSMNETGEEVDMTNAIVDGFRDGIKLLSHQVVGRAWMKDRETGKKLGGVLADDMGLGKTIQTLTRIVDGRPRKSDRDAGFAAATLVVCPVGLVAQWASEINKMAVGLRVVQHHGSGRTTNPEELKRAHIVVTSYSVLSSEHSAYAQRQLDKKAVSRRDSTDSSDAIDDSDSDVTGTFRRKFGQTVEKKGTKAKKIMDALYHMNWWRIVLDEAHNIKNRKTKASLACCALEGKYRWCLTGTPMQNNVEELYSLLKFLRIRPLNDWDTFNTQINKPVKNGRSIRAMKRLHVVLKAIMLRRKKDTLLNGKPLIQLPPRIVTVVHCSFDRDEREFYEAIQSKVELTLNKFVKNGDVMRNYTSVLVLLLRLRQACNHPSLVSKDFTADKEAVEPRAAKAADDVDDADELADLLGQMGMSSSRRCQMCQNSLSGTNVSATESCYCPDCEVLANKARRKSLVAGSSLPPESAKIRRIMQILADIDERSGEEKTIIFSQFTSMLDLIQPFLRERGIKYVRYDGSMRKEHREESLEKIRNSNSIRCILISFKAGSTGLNLTACNNVILVDLWWNPALEDQAFDRAHRFGQERQVNIYKLTIEHTVEERILALQEKKRELAAAALSGDKIKNSRLGLADLMDLFRPGGRDDEDE